MTLRSSLKSIIEETNTAPGKVFDWTLMALIVYSIITLTVESMPGLGERAQQVLRISEIVVTVLFSLEYGLRYYVADRKRDYVFGFWGVIDFLAVFPFYLTLAFGFGGIDLRGVRAFRLLRILRLLKIARYNKAIARFHRAFLIAKEEMVVYLFITLVLLYLAATGIYYFENEAQPEAFKSIAHSLWWALATLTTVGYGDVYPITVGGRIFTFFVLMVGLGIVAVPAGLLASALSQVRREDLEKKQLENKSEARNP